MNLSRLRPAHTIEVQKWLDEELGLTPYQREKFRSDEVVRFAPFKFYKVVTDEKTSPLWRLTILLFILYLVCLVVLIPINWFFTGKWGYSQKFLDKFHYKWVRKLKL